MSTEKKDKKDKKKDKKEKKEKKEEEIPKQEVKEEKTLSGDYLKRLFVSPIADPLATDKL